MESLLSLSSMVPAAIAALIAVWQTVTVARRHRQDEREMEDFDDSPVREPVVVWVRESVDANVKLKLAKGLPRDTQIILENDLTRQLSNVPVVKDGEP